MTEAALVNLLARVQITVQQADRSFTAAPTPEQKRAVLDRALADLRTLILHR